MAQAADEEKSQGVRCYRAQDYDGAIYHFSEALRHGPSDPAQVLGNRAAAFEKIGDFEAAAVDAKEALRVSPDYLKGYFRLATALSELQLYAEAEQAAEAGLRKQPRNTQLIELRDKARAQKRMQDARAAASGNGAGGDAGDEDDEESEEEDESEEEEQDGAEAMQASPYGAGGRTAARPSNSSAAPMEEEGPPAARAEAAKAAGNNEYKAGRYNEAIRHYSEAVRLAPQNATYLINRAAGYLMLQQAEEALADCNNALAHEPNLVKAHVRAAKSLVLLGRLSDARRQLELGQTFGAADAALQQELGTLAELENALRSAKDTLRQEGGAPAREALRLYTLLVERCPCSPQIACAQMEALLRARPEQGPSQVISESTRWLRKFGDNPDLLCVRGKALYGNGQVDAALKHFAEALRLDPDHSDSRKMRQRIKELEKAKEAGKDAFQAGKYKEAAELYTQAMQIDPDNLEVAVTLYTNRATARFKCHDFKGSIADCDKALDVQPRHLKALLRRAACRMELEEWNAAITDYEAAHNIEPEDNAIRAQLRQAKVELKKAGRKCLYKILGLTRRATDQEIKKAYKKTALQYHPDRHSGASDSEKADMEIKFKELGEAYEVLSDPQKKQRWDSGETLDEINGNAPARRGGGMGGGIDPSDIFRAHFGGGGGFGGFR